MLDLPVHYFLAQDGGRLAYREVGEGRPLILLHGFFSLATHQWVHPGHAAVLAAHGHRVIMPDMRGHGASCKPHRPDCYPPDILADDVFALIAHLELTHYDLVGYSLGARTVVRVLVRGGAPGRAVVAGQGLDQLTSQQGGSVSALIRRVCAGLGTFATGTSEWKAEQWLRFIDADPSALLQVLDTVVATRVEELARIVVPTLVVAGSQDDRVQTTAALAALLHDGHQAVVPGDHTTAIAAPQMGATIAAFLHDQ